MLESFLDPLREVLEPFKKAEFKLERGIPVLHENLNCSELVDDPQCLHPQMARSPIVGAGHHVRAHSNTPIIGILMQPLPQEQSWMDAYSQAKAGSEKNMNLNMFVEASHV